VQAVEDRHEVVVLAGIALGAGHLEPDSIAEAGVLRRLARMLDRRLVIVEADEAGGRKRLRHDEGRRAVAASDVGLLGGPVGTTGIQGCAGRADG
jgi:hypothetical protein